MNKTYHYEIPAGKYEGVCSDGFNTIEECVEACKKDCIELEIDYSHRDVKLFVADGDNIEECTEDGGICRMKITSYKK